MKDLKTLFSKYAIYFVLVFEIIFFSLASQYFLSATNFCLSGTKNTAT